MIFRVVRAMLHANILQRQGWQCQGIEERVKSQGVGTTLILYTYDRHTK